MYAQRTRRQLCVRAS